MCGTPMLLLVVFASKVVDTHTFVNNLFLKDWVLEGGHTIVGYTFLPKQTLNYAFLQKLPHLDVNYC